MEALQDRKSKSSTKVGKCELCQTDELELQNSHFIPKFVYARLNLVKKTGTRIEISDNKLRLYNLDTQITGYKFCAECEKKLDQGGENYFAKVGIPSKQSRIPILWEKVKQHVTSDKCRALPDQITGIDSKQIYHFALGLFWRATLSWDKHQAITIPVGVTEEIRKYLDKGGDFPVNVQIGVFLDMENERYSVALPSMKGGTIWFTIMQLDFILYVDCHTVSSGNEILPLFYSIDSAVSNCHAKIAEQIYEDSTPHGKVRKSFSI